MYLLIGAALRLSDMLGAVFLDHEDLTYQLENSLRSNNRRSKKAAYGRGSSSFSCFVGKGSLYGLIHKIGHANVTKTSRHDKH